MKKKSTIKNFDPQIPFSIQNVSYSMSIKSIANLSYLITLKKPYVTTDICESEISLEKLIKSNSIFSNFDDIEEVLELLVLKIKNNEVQINDCATYCEIIFSEKIIKSKREFIIQLTRKTFLSNLLNLQDSNRMIEQQALKIQSLEDQNRILRDNNK